MRLITKTEDLHVFHPIKKCIRKDVKMSVVNNKKKKPTTIDCFNQPLVK